MKYNAFKLGPDEVFVEEDRMSWIIDRKEDILYRLFGNKREEIHSSDVRTEVFLGGYKISRERAEALAYSFKESWDRNVGGDWECELDITEPEEERRSDIKPETLEPYKRKLKLKDWYDDFTEGKIYETVAIVSFSRVADTYGTELNYVVVDDTGYYWHLPPSIVEFVD